jgi:hypothetical protein
MTGSSCEAHSDPHDAWYSGLHASYLCPPIRHTCDGPTQAWRESCDRQLGALHRDVARLAAAVEELKPVVAG